MMKIYKQFSFFRLYLAVCALGISAYTYAEYYGYVITGSDENQRENITGRSGAGHPAIIHHK